MCATEEFLFILYEMVIIANFHTDFSFFELNHKQTTNQSHLDHQSTLYTGYSHFKLD